MLAGIRRLEINKFGREGGPLLNKGKTRLGPVTHQLFDGAFGFGLSLVRNNNPKQRSAAWIHCCLFELSRHHFAQALEAADFDIGLAFEFRAHQFVFVSVITRIGRLAAMGESVERRHSQKKMTIINEFRHLPPKEGD